MEKTPFDSLDIERYIEQATATAKVVSPRVRDPLYNKKKLEQIAQSGFFTIPNDFFFADDNQVHISLHHYLKTAEQARKQPPHNHDFFELSYVYKGTYHQCVGDKEITQTPEKLIMFAPRALHNTHIEEKQDIVFNILLNRSFVENSLQNILDSNSIVCQFFLDNSYLRNLYEPYMVFDCNDRLKRLIHRIIIEYFDEREFYESFITAHMVELFLEFSRFSQEHPDNARVLAPQPKPPSNIMQYVRRNYAIVNLEKLSKQFSYSKSHISHLIQVECGLSFSQMIKELRIKNACQYLINSAISIDRIIGLVGYNDVSYFYQIFRKQIGMTPQQYRSTHRISPPG